MARVLEYEMMIGVSLGLRMRLGVASRSLRGPLQLHKRHNIGAVLVLYVLAGWKLSTSVPSDLAVFLGIAR